MPAPGTSPHPDRQALAGLAEECGINVFECVNILGRQIKGRPTTFVAPTVGSRAQGIRSVSGPSWW